MKRGIFLIITVLIISLLIYSTGFLSTKDITGKQISIEREVAIPDITGVSCSLPSEIYAPKPQNILVEEIIHNLLIRNSDEIKRVGEELKVDPRIIASIIYVEQFQYSLRWQGKVEDFLSVALGNRVLIAAGASIGPYQIKESTIIQIDEHLRDPNSIFYLGPEFENYIWERPLEGSGSISTSETRTILEDEKLAIKVMGAMLAQFQKQWKEDPNGIDISNRPAILATLFNIGFERSKPKQNPQSGGAVYRDIHGVEKSFGDRAYDWYVSNKLIEIFQKRDIPLRTTEERLGFNKILSIDIDSGGNILVIYEDLFMDTYLQKFDKNLRSILKTRILDTPLDDPYSRKFDRNLRVTLNTPVNDEFYNTVTALDSAVDSLGNIYYLTAYDINQRWVRGVIIIDPEGKILELMELRHIDVGFYPQDIFIDKEDNLVITYEHYDPSTRSSMYYIDIYDRELNLLGSIRDNFNRRIQHISFDDANNYYIKHDFYVEGISYRREIIDKYDKNLNLIQNIIIPDSKMYFSTFEVDDVGNLYLGYTRYYEYFSRIIKLNKMGETLNIWDIDRGVIRDITFDKGKLYVAFEGHFEILDLEGNIIETVS